MVGDSSCKSSSCRLSRSMNVTGDALSDIILKRRILTIYTSTGLLSARTTELTSSRSTATRSQSPEHIKYDCWMYTVAVVYYGDCCCCYFTFSICYRIEYYIVLECLCVSRNSKQEQLSDFFLPRNKT